MKCNYCSIIPHISLCALLPLLLFAQVERWVYAYNGTNNTDDEAYVVAYGDDGNIYAAGYSTGDGTNQDFTVISLTPAGNERWVYIYNGQVSQSDIAYDLVYGHDGNIYVVGTSTNITDTDITIISITADGIERWVYTYNGPLGQEDEAFSIVYGSDHNIYAAGRSRGIGTEYDFTIVSVDTAGSERWIYRYDRDNWNDGANSVVYGLDDNIYAAGYTYHWIPTQEFAIFSVDTAGTQRWIKNITGCGSSNETALSIICGSDTNLYIVGRSNVMSYTVSSIDTIGTWRWMHWYGQLGQNNATQDVVQGQDRNTYSVGHLHMGTHYDFVVSAHNTAGDSLWMVMYDGPSQNHDVGYSLDFGDNSSVYAAGWSNGLGSGEDFVVIDVDTTGSLRWVYRFNGSANSSDRAYSVVYGEDDNVYAAGCCFDSTTNLDFLVISLDTTTTCVAEDERQVISNNDLLFPTYITGSLVLPEDQNCKIFDITGCQIHTLNPAPGIYFIEVNGKIAQKVIKVK
ncbi:MAG: hypothetical protein WBB37_08155 [bacterium]